MINLSTLTKPQNSPMIITIVGEGGIGKTTLASQFPNPVMIRTEDGSKSLFGRDDVALFPVAEKSDDVFEALEALAKENHNFQTVIFDSVTKFNNMVEREVVELDGKAKSINTVMGGYGAGIKAVALYHQRVKQAIDWLKNNKGMHAVFIAHTKIETVTPPDMESGYTRYTLNMHDKCLAPYTDDVDIVAYLKLKKYTTGEGSVKRAHSDQTRIITCYPTPDHVSKNRYGITTDIEWSLNEFPFMKYL